MKSWDAKKWQSYFPERSQSGQRDGKVRPRQRKGKEEKGRASPQPFLLSTKYHNPPVASRCFKDRARVCPLSCGTSPPILDLTHFPLALSNPATLTTPLPRTRSSLSSACTSLSFPSPLDNALPSLSPQPMRWFLKNSFPNFLSSSSPWVEAVGVSGPSPPIYTRHGFGLCTCVGIWLSLPWQNSKLVRTRVRNILALMPSSGPGA